MYMMVGIDRAVYGDETSFVQGLIKVKICVIFSVFYYSYDEIVK